MENNYIKITNFGNNFVDQISSYMIMESDELVSKCLPYFEDAIRQGYNPDDVKEQIFDYLKINEDDINDVDAKRLVDEVRKMYSRYH